MSSIVEEKVDVVNAEECKWIGGKYEDGKCVIKVDKENKHFDVTVNYLKRWGIITKTPGIILVPRRKDKIFDAFGVLDNLYGDYLEYAIYRGAGLTLGEVQDFLEDETDVVVDAFIVNNEGNVEKRTYKYIHGEWRKYEETPDWLDAKMAEDEHERANRSAMRKNIEDAEGGW